MEESTKPTFNFSLATLQRLHDSLVLCNECKINHNYEAWFDALDVVFSEIYPMIDEPEQYEIMLNDAEKLKNRYIGILNENNALPQRKRGDFDISELIKSLRNIERLLRKEIHKQQIYMDYKEVEDAAFALR